MEQWQKGRVCHAQAVRWRNEACMKIGGIQKLSTVDYPGYIAASIFTIGCNMRCGYCHNPELVLPERYADTIPVEDIMQFLQSRRGLLDAVVISGGEPTMHADLPEFIEGIKRMGFRVKLDTNGMNPDMVRELIDNKLIDFVAMDIKGPLEKYVAIAARPIDHRAIMRSINEIRRIDHEFRTTITTIDIAMDDIEEIGQMVKGAKRFALQRFVPGDTISMVYAGAKTFSDEQMEQAKMIMQRYVTECVVH